jgi:hypothetical protein
VTPIVLVLPPLVETNFGQIYPSTAVLAAYLVRHGCSVLQLDLNHEFFDHIVSDEELLAHGAGIYRRGRPETVAAARWTRARLTGGSLSRAELLMAQRKQPLNAIVRHLIAPYSVDPDVGVLAGSSDDPRLDGSYDRFFAARVEPLLGSLSADTLIGISVPMGPQILPALRLASTLRRLSPPSRCRIVLGGPALSLLGEAELTELLRQNPAVDCIIRFDGEAPLHALASQVSAGTWMPERIAATSLLRNGAAHHSEPAAGPALDSLPAPLYSSDLVARSPHARLGVLQARGCYWGKCDYCDFVEVYKGSPSYRSRDAELVVDDIRTLVRQTGIQRYRVITESIPPSFARRFSELLCESGLDVRWSSFIMVDRRFDLALLRLMAASGCDLLVVGLESMVTRVLNLVHKAADREENIRFMTDARYAGLQLYVNLIPDLPSTTRDEAMEGLGDLERISHCIGEAHVIPFEATRSSRVGRAPGQFGLVPVASLARAGHAQLAVNTLPVVDPGMTSVEREEVFGAYRRFAAKVNTRNSRALDDVSEYTVVVERPEGPCLFNFATLEQVELEV